MNPRPSPAIEILVIGNPGNRRLSFFQEAAQLCGVGCRVLSWLELLAGAPVRAEHIRIESPGEDWSVESALVGRVEREDRGRIRGLEAAHQRMSEALGRLPNAHFMNAPADILAMFDKVETKRRLGPLAPSTYGQVRCFEELREVMREAPRRRAFVKPRHGSSASGVVALTMTPTRVAAVTSAEIDGTRLYNSLRIRRYENFAEVERLIDLLGAEDELLVEEWVPKATTQGGAFDLRVVVIDGAADHVVARVSPHPMTNLHLGNSRGDLEALIEQLGARQWGRVLEAARLAMKPFPGTLYAGVDVGVTARRDPAVVFEVNAFGDLLPGVLDRHGRDTYLAQLQAYLKRHAPRPDQLR